VTALSAGPVARTDPPLGLAAELLGLSWQVHADPYEVGLAGLVRLAVRDNERRAQLVVSRVLAKHIPAEPSVVCGAALLLAGRVARILGAVVPAVVDRQLLDPAHAGEVRRLFDAGFGIDALVLGYCETATGLGHGVADALGAADYLHTTRRPVPGMEPVAGFDEEHSHAVQHHLLPADHGLLRGGRPLVLVDDELTTGTTSLNTIAALQARWPRDRYVLATLTDLRSAAMRAAFDARAAALGVRVDVAALVDATLTTPEDVLERARAARDVLGAVPSASSPNGTARVISLEPVWPVGVPLGGRHGFRPTDRRAHGRAIAAAASRVAALLPPGPVLVVGTEELMHTPIRLADELSRRHPGRVLVQSTTRSPVLVADSSGYAVRRVVIASAPDDPARLTRLHNLVDPDIELPDTELPDTELPDTELPDTELPDTELPDTELPDTELPDTELAPHAPPPYTAIVLVTDTPAAAAEPLAGELARWAAEVVAVVPLLESLPFSLPFRCLSRAPRDR